MASNALNRRNVENDSQAFVDELIRDMLVYPLKVETAKLAGRIEGERAEQGVNHPFRGSTCVPGHIEIGWLESRWRYPLPHDGKCGFENTTATDRPACGTCEYCAGGSMLSPDIRILTEKGVSECLRDTYEPCGERGLQ